MYLGMKRECNYAPGIKNRFERLYFAACAVSRDDLKPSLMNVLIEENRILGCDGHRLHITEGDVGDLVPGQYWPIKITKSRLIMVKIEGKDLDRYPDIDAVWPDLSKYKSFGLGYVSNPQDTIAIVSNYVNMCRAGEPRGCNYKNFAELLGNKFNFTSFYVKMGSAVAPIVFEGEVGARGLLMPTRIDGVS